MYGQPVFWRETMMPARFLFFDVRITVVLFPAFMHVRIWTFLVAVIAMAVFVWLERKGVSMDASLRYLRARIVGRRRSARGLHEERLAVDFGNESETWLQRERMRVAAHEVADTPGLWASLLSALGLSSARVKRKSTSHTSRVTPEAAVSGPGASAWLRPDVWPRTAFHAVRRAIGADRGKG
ncbi:MAG: hypothetical protein F4213_11800 [Boseongicola sp. SB0677_bin_26]|nr:hypothetical protein [Boseongicola sp. SB0665_bin_10]MYG26689.1 hypothetical protein [Boseongicola sp. SB0677_bin_26]